VLVLDKTHVWTGVGIAQLFGIAQSMHLNSLINEINFETMVSNDTGLLESLQAQLAVSLEANDVLKLHLKFIHGASSQFDVDSLIYIRGRLAIGINYAQQSESRDRLIHEIVAEFSRETLNREKGTDFMLQTVNVLASPMEINHFDHYTIPSEFLIANSWLSVIRLTKNHGKDWPM